MPPVLDCTAAVLDGVWPYELARPRPETEAVSRYLHNDLLRIVQTTNDRLAELQASDLHPEARRYAEDRFIRTARAMAVLRVESTVRQIGGMSILGSPGMPELMRPPEARPRRAEEVTATVRPDPPAPEVTAVVRPTRPVEETRVIPAVWPSPREREVDTTLPVAREVRQPSRPAPPVVDVAQVFPFSRPPRHSSADPEDVYESGWSEPTRVVDAAPSEGFADGVEVRSADPVAHVAPVVEPVAGPVAPRLPRPAPVEPPVVGVPEPDAAAPPIRYRSTESAPYLAPAVSNSLSANGSGGVRQGGQGGLEPLVGSLARQEPSLKWLIGERPDGSTVVVTDVLSGWIPPGVVLAAGLTVLAPQRRDGRMEDWVGPLQGSARYAPGDRIDGRRATSSRVTEEPFAVVEVADNLGWSLGEATLLHEGIPRIVHTLARAAAAGTGVNEAELDVLRVHVETAVQTMLSAYPDVNEQMAVSCMLMGATEAMAGQHATLAAYHFGWYQAFAGRRWE